MYTDQWISFINKYRLINLYQLYIYKINGMTTPYYINTYLLIVSYIITNIIGYDWVILISIINIYSYNINNEYNIPLNSLKYPVINSDFISIYSYGNLPTSIIILINNIIIIIIPIMILPSYNIFLPVSILINITIYIIIISYIIIHTNILLIYIFIYPPIVPLNILIYRIIYILIIIIISNTILINIIINNIITINIIIIIGIYIPILLILYYDIIINLILSYINCIID